MTQQIHHSIRRGWSVLRGEEADGSGRGVLRQGCDTRRVDQDDRLQRLQRPADVDPLDLLCRESAEVEHEQPVIASDRHPAWFADTGMQGDGRCRREAVPGDDARALPGVRGGDPLAEHSVEERRLARLHHSGQGQSQGLVQTLLELLDDLELGGIALVDVAGRSEEVLGDLDDGCRHESARPNPPAPSAPTGLGVCSIAWAAAGSSAGIRLLSSSS